MSRKRSANRQIILIFILISLSIVMMTVFYDYTNNQLIVYHIDESKRFQKLSLYCPKGYKTCTDDISDIANYVLNSYQDNDTCVSHPNEHPNAFYTHSQGDWLNLSQSRYPSVTQSEAYHLHRFYYSIPIQPKYAPLMNSPATCDINHENLYIVKHQSTLNNTGFHQYQCNLTLQNKSSSYITVEYNEYSKWYPDNDNYIDIITANDIYTLGTDLYNKCNNEGYTPRECCGQSDRIHNDRASWVHEQSKRVLAKYIEIWGKDFVINVAQSRGYFHFFVESMPRLAPFINLLKEMVSKNLTIGNKTLEMHINIASTQSPKYFLYWLFRHEIKTGNSRITLGFTHNYPKYSHKVIQPHATTCLWARERGSRLLNNIVRNEVELNANEKGLNITKDIGMKNIVLLKRNAGRSKHNAVGRFIRNFDELKSAIERVYTVETGYNVYIHDDTHMHKIPTFEYYVEFYKADIVIGAFGAGLVNIVFCKPGTAIILIQGSHHKNHRMYMAHSMALGMRYYAYFTETAWIINVTDVMKVIDIYA